MTESSIRGILTIATGKPVYVRMAVNLARSFKWWHKSSSIKFTIVTDQKSLIPNDLSDISVIEIKPGAFGEGFSPKLHLDQMTPYKQTLFIDADCLCVGSLEGVFNQFEGKNVSVLGGTISKGEWFGDVSKICKQFNIVGLPKFNGGVYYLELGDTCSKVYETARHLEPEYDNIGLVRLRNRPNDELLIAISMALHGETVVQDDGSIYGDPQECPGDLKIDVIRGRSKLVNPPFPDIRHRDCYPFEIIHPKIVHFLGHHVGDYQYRKEEIALELSFNRNWPAQLAIYGAWMTSFPHLCKEKLKSNLRPIYRKVFGVRKIKLTDRGIGEVHLNFDE